ncbi:hypothetical protein [Donghicola sp. XS_ASV15]
MGDQISGFGGGIKMALLQIVGPAAKRAANRALWLTQALACAELNATD